MKKLLLQSSIMALVSHVGIAQQNLQVSYFQVDNSYVVEATQLKPHSELHFYTTPEGGFVQQVQPVNETGKARFETTLSHLPAFILNERYVRHLGEREFLLQDLKATRYGEELTLSWQGAALPQEGISYVVLESLDGHTFLPLASLPASASHTTDYEYTTAYNIHASYRIAVYKHEQEVRYTSKILRIESEQEVYTLYPSYTQDKVQLDFINADLQGTYRIVSAMGQTVGQGMLSEQQNTIDVSSLSQGSYMVEIRCIGQRWVEKIVKL